MPVHSDSNRTEGLGPPIAPEPSRRSIGDSDEAYGSRLRPSVQGHDDAGSRTSGRDPGLRAVGEGNDLVVHGHLAPGG